MKRKFNTKGFIKNAAYGMMDGAALTLSWMSTGLLGYGAVYSCKNYGICNRVSRTFLWLTAASAFNAVRNTCLTSQYLNGEICDYDFMIMTNDDEDEEVDEI